DWLAPRGSTARSPLYRLPDSPRSASRAESRAGGGTDTNWRDVRLLFHLPGRLVRLRIGLAAREAGLPTGHQVGCIPLEQSLISIVFPIEHACGRGFLLPPSRR